MFKDLINYPIKQFKKIKAEYLNSSPKEKWNLARNFANLFLRLAGIAVLDREFKVWWYSYVCTVLISNFALSILYTLWYYADSPTPLKGFLFIPMLGVVTSLLDGYLLLMISSRRKKVTKLLYFTAEHIYTDTNENSNSNYIEACNQSARKLIRSVLKTHGIFVVLGVIYMIFPIFAYLMHNEIQLILPVLLPFTDLESIEGEIINILNQFITISMGVCGHLAMETAFCIMKNSFWAMCVGISYSLDGLVESLKPSERTSNRIVEHHFRNVFLQFEDRERILLEYADLLYWNFFLQPLTLNLSCAFSLFFFLDGVWISGLGMGLVSHAQLFILCKLGSHLSEANEMLLLKFHEMPWYLMSKKNQTTYAYLLNRLQNGIIFRVGPFVELNLETFAIMTKRIYSFLTTLRRLLK